MYDQHMRSWTQRLTTPHQRKQMREACIERNLEVWGELTCESCRGHLGEVSPSGRTITSFEMDHLVNVSTAGVDRELRYRLETDPRNHQMLCEPCHYLKTLSEAREGRKRASSRSKRKHPGIIG